MNFEKKMPGEARDECALTLHSIPYRQCLSSASTLARCSNNWLFQFLIGNVLARLFLNLRKWLNLCFNSL